MNKKSMCKNKIRCGICQRFLKNCEDWDFHVNSEEYMRNISDFDVVVDTYKRHQKDMLNTLKLEEEN